MITPESVCLASELWQNRNSSEFVLSTLIKLNQDQNFTVPRPRRLLYDLLALYENSEEIVSQLLDLIVNSKHTLSGVIMLHLHYLRSIPFTYSILIYYRTKKFYSPNFLIILLAANKY